MTPLQLGLRANLEGWCWVSVPDAIGAASLWALLIKFQEITFFFFNFILVFFFAVGEEGWDRHARVSGWEPTTPAMQPCLITCMS